MTTSRKSGKKDDGNGDADKKPATIDNTVMPVAHSLHPNFPQLPSMAPTLITASTNTSAQKKPAAVKKTPPRAKHTLPVQVPEVASLSPESALPFTSATTAPASKQSPILPACLETFGIKPPPVIEDLRDGKLKCCLVMGPRENVIAFRIQPNDPRSSNGSWPEELFNDAVVQKNT